MRAILFSIFTLFLLNSCIKPYACECENVQTLQKSHVLVYASKKNSEEACKKNGSDTTIFCKVK